MTGGEASTLVLEDGDGPRRIGADAFPVTLMRAGTQLRLRGAAEESLENEAPIAFLGLSEGDLFIQRAEGATSSLTVGGAPLEGSRWLEPGDSVRAGGSVLEIASHGSELRLTVAPTALPSSKIPVLVPPPRPAVPPEGEAIEPVTFRPRAIAGPAPRRRWTVPMGLLAAALLLILGGAAALLFSARSLELAVEPAPDSQRVEGGLSLNLGERTVLLPGKYKLVAEKAGYRRLEAAFVVDRETQSRLRFSLEKLPGKLQVSTGGLVAEVVVDGEAKGRTPLASPLEIAPGEHEIRISAPRHQDFLQRLIIEGAGKVQTLEATLEPRWAPVSISSEPSGAAVHIDGRSAGTTPLTVDLGAGTHQLELSLEGRKTQRRRIQVVANEPLTVPLISLPVPAGRLSLESQPSGATVTVDGTYRGETPLSLEVEAGKAFEIKVSKAGFETAARRLSAGPGQEARESFELSAILGEVVIEVSPADALVFLDGEPRGQGSQSLELPARPHRLEVRREGYGSFDQTVTPKPGLPQTLQVTLDSKETLQARATPPLIETAEGHQLRLLPSGRLTLGAPRREPGRRSNEIERPVILKRKAYLGTQEVSNRQFRRFRKSHRSGEAAGKSLETDHHPVVRVSWEDAVAYCNWLSEAEGLPPAYALQGSQWVLIQPVTTGYRLPTEAEWAWAARFPKGAGPRKYPWGETLPIPAGAGNYADASAQGVAPNYLPDYRDGFPATAPVESFGADAGGFFHLGGNVAEWIHDHYGTRPEAGEATDPLGPAEGEHHVIRGSSWRHSTVTELRLTFRDYGSEPRPDVGFRIARYGE